MFFSLLSYAGLMASYTHIKTQDEIVKIKTDAQAISNGNLFIELVKLKLSTWLPQRIHAKSKYYRHQ